MILDKMLLTSLEYGTPYRIIIQESPSHITQYCRDYIHPRLHTTHDTHSVSKKLCKLIFCQNFCQISAVKIFGTKIAERTNFSEVYLFSTSPNLCQPFKRRCSKLLYITVIISLQ